jgi:hypothetical protein
MRINATGKTGLSPQVFDFNEGRYSRPVRQRGRELFLQDLCLGENTRVTGTFALETDPERLYFGARFRHLGPFSPGFLRRMVVEWWFAMHTLEW